MRVGSILPIGPRGRGAAINERGESRVSEAESANGLIIKRKAFSFDLMLTGKRTTRADGFNRSDHLLP